MCITSLENLTAESLLTPPGVDLRDCIDDFRAGLTTWIGVFRGDTRLGLTNLISISSSSDVALCMNVQKYCFCARLFYAMLCWRYAFVSCLCTETCILFFVVCSLRKSRQLNTHRSTTQAVAYIFSSFPKSTQQPRSMSGRVLLVNL